MVSPEPDTEENLGVGRERESYKMMFSVLFFFFFFFCIQNKKIKPPQSLWRFLSDFWIHLSNFSMLKEHISPNKRPLSIITHRVCWAGIKKKNKKKQKKTNYRYRLDH